MFRSAGASTRWFSTTRDTLPMPDPRSMPTAFEDCSRGGAPWLWRSTLHPVGGANPIRPRGDANGMLRELGVNIFLTPSDEASYAGPFYDWIRAGERAYLAAAE